MNQSQAYPDGRTYEQREIARYKRGDRVTVGLPYGRNLRARITRNMKQAVCEIATGRPLRQSEGILRECVSVGLLELEHGEYTPTAWGVTRFRMRKPSTKRAARKPAAAIQAQPGIIHAITHSTEHTMITRNMKQAVCEIATGRPLRQSEGILRECVSVGLLELEHGEYTPTAWGYEVSNEETSTG